jgi:hypothetical protein
MPWTFNPFSGTFDQKGSGGGGGSAFFAGEVATYADLPLDGTAALDSRWLVRSNSGTWPFSSYKQAGVYVRKATVGASRDNDYQLTDTSFHDVMSDAAFLIYDNTDPTKAAKFDVGANVAAGQTRTLSIPNANGTIALLSDLILSKLSGTVVLAPTSDANTTSTTPASVAGMSFTAQANTNYLVIASLQLDVAASGGGCVLDASTPNINGGATANGIQCVNSTTISALVAPSSTSIRAFRATAAQTSSGLVGAAFSISTVRFTAGGTVDFNWALVSSSANTSTLKSSSRVVLIPIT